jgi:hypothetical protein
MNLFKKILLGVAGLLVLLLFVAVFLPASYQVERSIEIGKAPEVVFEQVVDLNNWMKWNPWSEMDPAAKNTFSGGAKQAGATWAWEGEVIGTGSLTIEKIEPHQRLESKLVFVAPQQGEAKDTWRFEPTANGTKVIWHNTGGLDYPIGRYVGLMIEGSVLGPQFEKGLANLKRVCEALPEPMPRASM